VELELSIETKDTGAVQVERLALEKRIVLGRGPESPIPLDGPLISREHLAFERDDEQVLLLDVSANGSWFNGEAMVPGRPYPIGEADRIQIPGYELRCAIILPDAVKKPVPKEAAVNPVLAFGRSITGMEISVLIVVGLAVALAVIFYQG
jgi:pSer/pThr/pTyr-binding forkhead associated (FHA) protein